MTALDWAEASFCFAAVVALLAWLLVNLVDVWPRYPASRREPLSPTELYLEGGGDLSNPRVASLLAEAERGWNRRHQADDD